MTELPVLEINNITKSFSGFIANNAINMSLKRGEVHVLLGENGAGKSTLMNVISGLYKPDSGEIRLNGKPVQLKTPRDAIRLGIGMIHQHFMVVPGFSTVENIMLGNEFTQGPLLDMTHARKSVKTLSETYGLDVDPDAITDELPVGLQQRVEILKALFVNASVLILDEPTAVLTPQESEDLFTIIKRLTQSGVSIFFITHKLKEVMAVADRITVIRHGEIIGTTTPDKSDDTSLAEMMVGRSVDLESPWHPGTPAGTVFEISNLQVSNDRNILAVSGVSLSIQKGEIIGIAGVQGNGQTELAEAVTGLRPLSGGSLSLSGIRLTPGMLTPGFLIENGMGHIPEDRQKHGLILPFSIGDNQVLSTWNKPPFSKAGHRRQKAISRYAINLIRRYDIRTSSHKAAVSTLSGGNQQKVIISRELSREIKFLVANQPTRGLDVGAIEYIHKQLLKLRNKGAGILLISSELDEILSLSDRIAVMYKGKIVKLLPREEVTRGELGVLMSGSV